MVTYHLDADKEFDDILQVAGRDVKKCLGQMIQRHVRIALGQEPLTHTERVGAGSGASTLYRVEYVYGLLASVECVYGVDGASTEVLAIDARQGINRLGLPAHAPDALARAWGRST
jgi:hypothetical protein